MGKCHSKHFYTKYKINLQTMKWCDVAYSLEKLSMDAVIED
jgi:hypothetical protein